MRAFTNANPDTLDQAVSIAKRAQIEGSAISFAGGGSDLLQLVKDAIVQPDVIVNLKTIKGLDQVASSSDGLEIGGLTTLTNIATHPVILHGYSVLAEAAAKVASPQIRNVGTLAGNVCQRPWCWYFRNGFPCYKNGGRRCFSVGGENRLHAILGGGPSYIVHPSDTAPALVALKAKFRVAGPSGQRMVSADDFFVLPRQNAAHENVLSPDEVLFGVQLPQVPEGRRSTYYKIMDRETWTHAVASAAIVLDMENGVCQNASIVLGGVAPIPWRLGSVEALLSGQRITPELAVKAGEVAVVDAHPLARNAYKVPLVRGLVRRTLLELAARVA